MNVSKIIFMSLLAIFALSSCSQDKDSPIDNPVNTSDLHYAYVNFAGKATRGGGTEATVDTKVESALFLFFKDGTQVADPYLIKEGMKDLEGNEFKDIKGGGLIVLRNMIAKPTQIYVVLNLKKKGLISEFRTLTKNQLIKKVADYRLNDTYDVEGKTNNFVMTNEALLKSEVKHGVDCLRNIMESAKEAKSNPVTIKVDRVLAGVNVNKADVVTYKFSKVDKYTDGEGVEHKLKGNQIVLDGKIVDITVEYPGYWINNLATDKAYLFKNAETTWNASTPFEGAVKDGKINWATSAATKYLNRPWKDASDGKLGETGAKFQLAKNYYLLENTSGNKPSLIVGAKFKVDGAKKTFYRFAHKYATIEKLKDFFMSDLNIKTLYKSDGTTQFAKTDFNWEEIVGTDGLKPWQAKFKITAINSNEYYTYDGGSLKKLTIEQVNNILKKVETTCKRWLDGQAYFQLPFIHEGTFAASKAEGIVRNHMYKFTFNKIVGLGIPVSDEEGGIDPGEEPEEEKETYLAAKIEINEWVEKKHENIVLK